MECAFTSPVRTKCGIFVMQYMQCCMSVSAVRGCAVSRTYIHVCNCDMFSVVYVYIDHLKFCVVCIDCRMYVCCSECNVVSNVRCPPPVWCNLSVRNVVKLCTLGVWALRVSLVS